MKTILRNACIILLAASTLSCVTIRQGNVGVKRTLGKIDPDFMEPGARLYNIFATKIITVPVRTENIEVTLELPSKEGLNVKADISILYHIEKSKATEIVGEIGMDYESTIILPVFRASAADVTAKYMAKDMHTGNRFEIETAIKEQMMKIIGSRGFEIEAVLMKSIQLPQGLYKAIEEKLEAEQDAQRMEFILLKEKQEALRRTIEAEGIRDANQIISEGLTPQIIQYQTIEAYRELSKSPNAKLIIGNGQQPILLEP
ncbi:prohibitin family protein [Cryomorpha ignava]|uniref:Prohibitin family protein n=2 Tax=Cryomorpha ignava TaxID=101383 RepID=A0A7K3WU74_9FLAO|nr:prohibitin family protein [Cryomorpha ignava]